MPMKIEELLTDKQIIKDENELDNWGQRIQKYLVDNIHLRTAFTETEIYKAMASEYRNPPPEFEIIKNTLKDMAIRKMIFTKIHNNILYYWME